MSLSERLNPLMALCYEATSEKDGWPRFAAALTRELSATGCAAIAANGRDSGQTVYWSHGNTPSPSGNWLPDGFEPNSTGPTDPTPRVLPGADGGVLIGLVSGSGAFPQFVVVARSADGRGFDGRDSALLDALLPHIDRAMRVCRAIRDGEWTHRALSEILDRLPEAVFLVDGAGTVVSSNQAARAIARQNDGLALIDDRICISQPDEQETLRALIAKAANSIAAPSRQGGRVMSMSVSRPSCKTALPVVVTPVLRRDVPDGRPSIAAAVITKDTERRGAIMVPDLTRAFGLTPGEGRLAGLVAGGLGLRDAAEVLGITRNTVRTHMKRVYAKTGVHSQADLVRLLSRGSIELRRLEADG